MEINTYIVNNAPEMNLTFCKGKFIRKWIFSAMAEQ